MIGMCQALTATQHRTTYKAIARATQSGQRTRLCIERGIDNTPTM